MAVVLATVGTRPAAAAVREQAGPTVSPELACYVRALGDVFDGAAPC